MILIIIIHEEKTKKITTVKEVWKEEEENAIVIIIIHEEKTKEITTVKEVWKEEEGNVILIVIKFCKLLLRISPRMINTLRSYIIHSKECFLLFPNTSKLVKKTRLRLFFPTYFLVF